MSYLPADQRELFLPLYEGIRENPPWGAFMRNLVGRTNARRAFMVVEPASAAPSQAGFVCHVAAPRAVQEPPLDLERLRGLNLQPFKSFRPGRVYALEEILDYDNPSSLAMQQSALEELGMRFGRILRVTARNSADAWLVLVREREDFSAAAVALLSNLAPHIGVALSTLIALNEQRILAAMSEQSLAQIGCAQLAFDSAGLVMMADTLAEQVLTFAPDPSLPSRRRLQLLPTIARALAEECLALTGAPKDARRIIRLGGSDPLDLMLRPSNLRLDGPVALPAVLGTLRLASQMDSPSMAGVISKLFGLSYRESGLAHGLTLGLSIVEAGARLRLTPETSRNYSKRIYAKTGASGQADLVRMILTGLSPFA